VRAVEHVAADEDYVGAKLAELGDDSGDEVAALDVAEMRVGYEGGDTSTPGGWKAGKFDGDALDAEIGGVSEAVERGENGETKEENGDSSLGEGEIEHNCDADGDPGKSGRGEGEVHEAEPDAGEAIVGAHRAIEEAMSQQRRGKEANGKNGERDLEKTEPRVARRAGEGDPGFVDEEMDEKKNGLNDANGYGDARIQARTPCRRLVAWRNYWMCEGAGLVCGPVEKKSWYIKFQ